MITAGTSAALALIIVCVLGSVFLNWKFGLPITDKGTRINIIVAVGAFILVAVGVLVALSAYLAATGRPDLHVTLRFEFPDDSQSVIEDVALGTEKALLSLRWRGVPTIVNLSSYAARNPGIRIETRGFAGMPPQSGGWENMELNESETLAIQWDGGADRIIHGKWSRVLPPIVFEGIWDPAGDQALIVSLVADNFGPRRTYIPVSAPSQS